MEGSANYQFRILPSNPNSYMTLDSEPQRRSEAYLVYTITEDVFTGTNIKFRIRHRAKEFARNWIGKVFAVIYNTRMMKIRNVCISASYLLNKDYGMIAFIAPMIAILFWFIAVKLWNWGLKHYKSSGT